MGIYNLIKSIVQYFEPDSKNDYQQFEDFIAHFFG